MEFNLTFCRHIGSAFTSNDVSGSIVSLSNELSLEHNNTFNRGLITKIGGDEVEIPVIAREHIETVIKDNISFPYVCKVKFIILPLYENSAPQERRTFDSFIRQFFTGVGYNHRLQKITSNKGEVYYGGKGLILDDKYNPLIICTLKAKKVQRDNETQMVYYRPVVYVSPTVFIEPDKLINKGIIKKLIPYYTNREITFPRPRTGHFESVPDNSNNLKAVVIIDNLDRFFVKPIVPKPKGNIEESLNECLIDNIEDILAMV